MKEDVDKIIEDALGVMKEDKPIVKKETKEIVIPKTNGDLDQDVDDDYKYQRDNFYALVEKGQDAIDGILDLAKESDHPRAYEVAGNMIKSVADTVEKLHVLQEKMKEIHLWIAQDSNHLIYCVLMFSF